MVLPLSIIRSTVQGPILVELKNGETYSGILGACDNWMNMQLKEAVLTSKDGDKFWKLDEVFLRGNNVKYVRVPDEVIDIAKEEALKAADAAAAMRGGRGGRGGYAGGAGGYRQNQDRNYRPNGPAAAPYQQQHQQNMQESGQMSGRGGGRGGYQTRRY